MIQPVISLDLSPPSQNDDSFLQHMDTSRPISPPLFTSTPNTDMNMNMESEESLRWHSSWFTQHRCPDAPYENMSTISTPDPSPRPKTKDVEVQTKNLVADVGPKQKIPEKLTWLLNWRVLQLTLHIWKGN